MQLRDYQIDAVAKTWDWIRNNQGNPCIVLPTGAGKTIVIAKMIQDAINWNKNVIMVTHSAELLKQLEPKLRAMGINDFGIYSASLQQRSTENRIILGGIQSVYDKAHLFGKRHVCFVDEAHRINPTSDSTMYGRFFTDMGFERIVGLTATPYRLGSGKVCGPDSFLTEVSYEISVKQLVDEGYLCRLTSKWLDDIGIETSDLSVASTGDFVEAQQQERFLERSDKINEDVLLRADGRHSILIFCSGVEAVHKTADYLASRGHECGAITGDTDPLDRAVILSRFRNQEIRFLANCNVLTEGFDAPNIDCVVLERATVSPGLYYQMAGRGLRLCDSKSNCIILDYGQNIARHGPIDKITPGVSKKSKDGKAPVKYCPNCFEAVALSARNCCSCDHEFEFEDKTEKLDQKPSKRAAMSDEEDDWSWVEIKSLTFQPHTKKNGSESDPKTMKVSYYEGKVPWGRPLAQQWICVEHQLGSKARKVAEKWFKQWGYHSIPVSMHGQTTAEACSEFMASLVKECPDKIPTAIKVRPQKDDPRYWEVCELSWDPSHRKPEVSFSNDFANLSN